MDMNGSLEASNKNIGLKESLQSNGLFTDLKTIGLYVTSQADLIANKQIEDADVAVEMLSVLGECVQDAFSEALAEANREAARRSMNKQSLSTESDHDDRRDN